MRNPLTEEQKAKRRESQRKYANANKEKVLAASRKWNKENPQKMRDASNKHYEKIKDNEEFRKEQNKKTREWNLKNPEKVLMQSSLKRATKLKRMPKWLTKEQKNEISKFYKQAINLSKLLNQKHHVDHIIPLRGKTVSGLHVPWNLTIIPAKENMQKSNKFFTS